MELQPKYPSVNDEEKEIEQKMIKLIALMPKEVQNRFKVLKVLSDRRSHLTDQFEEEVKKLDADIAVKKKPLYELRRQIIKGELTDFTEYTGKFDETLTKLEQQCASIVTKTAEGVKVKEEIKAVDVEALKGAAGIPDFWYRSIKNNQMVYELVKEKDDEILKNLSHIESQRDENPKTLTV